MTAKKVIWIEPINDGPEIQSALGSYMTNEDFDLTITSDQLLSGFSDAEGDSLNVVNLKVDGEIIAEDSGTWTISALSNDSNDRTIQYTVTDGLLEKEVTTKITVNALRDYKISRSDLAAYAGFEGLEISAIEATSGVQVTSDETTVWISPEEAFQGQTSITYKILDENGDQQGSHTFNIISAYAFGKDLEIQISDAPNPTETGDTLQGSESNDQLFGGINDDTIYGLGGDDVLSGGDGNDSIEGGDGDDIITGEGGNDTISGGAGNDQIDGNEGNDNISDGDGSDTIDAGAGDDLITIDGNNDNNASDNVKTGSGNDIINVEKVKRLDIQNGEGSKTVNIVGREETTSWSDAYVNINTSFDSNGATKADAERFIENSELSLNLDSNTVRNVNVNTYGTLNATGILDGYRTNLNINKSGSIWTNDGRAFDDTEDVINVTLKATDEIYSGINTYLGNDDIDIEYILGGSNTYLSASINAGDGNDSVDIKISNDLNSFTEISRSFAIRTYPVELETTQFD